LEVEMAKKKETPASFVESFLGDLSGHVNGESTAMVERLAEAGADRAKRLETATARLAESLGDDHPRVVQLQRRANLLGSITTKLTSTVERLDAVPALRPHEWMAYGKLMGEDDRPLTGMRVIVFDADRKAADLLVDEITDERGEFRGIYHERDFRDEGEEVPELFVMVFDAKEKPVFRSDHPFLASPTRSDYIQITLTDQRLEEGLPRTPCEAMTAKGSRCRNKALVGETFCATHTVAE
jgi:hypothetical protein